MLFDLSSPGRKRVVRVVYSLLAIVFAGGFIFFGIGSEAGGGGLFDGLFGSGGSSGSTAEQYEQQIEDAEKTLETDPENANALATLARYRYLSGTAQLAQDETTGQVSVTDESLQEFEAAVDAWNRYLETDPRRPDVGTAGNMVQAFYALGDVKGAAAAQRILAEANPSAGTYSQLALLEYSSYEFKAGDRAAAEALAQAEAGERRALERQLDRVRAEALKQRKRQDKQAAQAPASPDALGGPLGGLGGDPTGLGAPGAP